MAQDPTDLPTPSAAAGLLAYEEGAARDVLRQFIHAHPQSAVDVQRQRVALTALFDQTLDLFTDYGFETTRSESGRGSWEIRVKDRRGRVRNLRLSIGMGGGILVIFNAQPVRGLTDQLVYDPATGRYHGIRRGTGDATRESPVETLARSIIGVISRGL